MKNFLATITITLGLFSATTPIPTNAFAEEAKGTLDDQAFIGYIDSDGDGANDLFRDRDGDGVNDMDDQPYRHNFEFVDKNGDGINDVFVDVDGDGVNDLLVGGGGKLIIMIDSDNDGRNDITGRRVTEDGLFGSDHGYIDEWRRIYRNSYSDKDGNGIDDRVDSREFFDTDGDGIDDRIGIGTGSRQMKRNRFTDKDGDGFNDCDGLGGRRAGDGRRHHDGGHRMGHGGDD